jgi:C4-dicarboxylate transporter, DctM subunit
MGLTEVSLGVLPFMGLLLLCLILVTFVPSISLFLTNLFLR